MNSNFLTNYSYTDELVNFMSLCRHADADVPSGVVRVEAIGVPSDQKSTDSKHFTSTLLLWASSLAIALSVTDLGIVLELADGISAVLIGFVMPALPRR